MFTVVCLCFRVCEDVYSVENRDVVVVENLSDRYDHLSGEISQAVFHLTCKYCVKQ